MVCLPCAAPFLVAGAGTGTAVASSNYRMWIILTTLVLTLLTIVYFVWRNQTTRCASCIN